MRTKMRLRGQEKVQLNVESVSEEFYLKNEKKYLLQYTSKYWDN